jgi:hypothetical protein
VQANCESDGGISSGRLRRSAFSSHEELKMGRYIILASVVTNGEGEKTLHMHGLQIGIGREEDAALNAN